MSSQQYVVHTSAARGWTAKALLATWCALHFAGAAFAQGSNRLERIEATPLSGNQLELKLHMSDAAPQPLTATVDNPARIWLDLPDTTLALPARRIDVKRGVVDTVTAAEANGRTRVVLNLDNLVPYETRVQGNVISVLLGTGIGGGAQPAVTTAAAPAAAAPRSAAASAPRAAASGGARSVSGVDFRRGSDGSGRIIVELSDARVPADLRQEGGRILVTFNKTTLPDSLMRRLDVVDFATPVNTVDVVRVGDSTRLMITATGDWEQVAYQSDNIYTIEVKPIAKAAAELDDKKEYTGERLTLNFQDIETRAVLQLLADTSGQDMVISDTVRGNVTLRLTNVPWDQALDIVLQTKGLDKRRQGNVILVAPAAEISAREKELATARKEITELAPLRTEYLQVNYAKALDLQALIKSGKGNTLLSERGNVSIDERTNTLLLQDTADRLADIRRLVSTLDIPVRQVQIEARVVIVNDDFTRDLGVRLGYTGVADNSSNLLGVSGSAVATDSIANSALDNLNTTGSPFPVSIPTGDSAPSRYMVNLPVANAAGRLATFVLGSDYLVDLELSAAQAEGRGEIISSPRVITTNQKEAIIEQGVEIPYQEAASSGATTTTFRKAVLSLKVTPQITPDNRIILDLLVTKDSVGQNVSSGISGGFIPSIDTRRISTQARVNDGQTVVLGGVLETEKRDTQRKVPWLGDIPVLGYLFKTSTNTNNKRELLIFVTPKILREGVSTY
ncbi:MAG TPA: type IV pilus secretin PilQ [Steroidobacteraceae bacterium]|nr:type IV pilus secretin PilQ [Steroidobacteraceae bacterium]